MISFFFLLGRNLSAIFSLCSLITCSFCCWGKTPAVTHFNALQWPLLTTYLELSLRAGRMCPRRKTTLVPSPRYRPVPLTPTLGLYPYCVYIASPFYLSRRTGLPYRRLSKTPPGTPPAKAWPLPARTWPWSTGSPKDATPAPLQNPFKARLHGKLSLLALTQTLNRWVTKYQNSYYESE